MMRLDGHDGSHHQWDQGPVDIPLLRSATDWIAWKATQSTSYVDPTFARTRAGVDAAGFTHKLAYHWLASTTNPVTQAEHYLNTVGSFGLWGAMLDAEEAGIGAAGCLAWCETVEDHLRRPCSVYSGLYVAGGSIWKSQALRTSAYGPRTFHLAAYVSEAKLQALMVQTGAFPLFPYHAWQFSSNGPVPGIVGRADMNRVDDRAAYDRVCGVVAPPPDPPPSHEEHDMPHFVLDETGDIWLDEIDWQGHEYTDTVGNLGIDWRLWDLPGLPVRQRALLEEKKAIQSRPTSPPDGDGGGAPVDVIAERVITVLAARLMA